MIRYFPTCYSTAPRLQPLGAGLVFELDDQFPHYHQAKCTARAENLAKYYQTHDLSPAIIRAVRDFWVGRLLVEYPQGFTRYGEQLHCHWTGMVVDLTHPEVLDTLALQVQEDLAVVCVPEQGPDWLAAIHLCFPNYWAAEAKIGRRFIEIHDTVPGMAWMTKAVPRLLESLVSGGPWVRFGWGLATDNRLNHHPEPPPGVAVTDWQGRRFDPAQPELYLRVERQVLWGLPEVRAFVFTIRTYLTAVADLSFDQRAQLAEAVQTMSPASRQYKGLDDPQILAWLLERS